jgi:hypothetical protein
MTGQPAVASSSALEAVASMTGRTSAAARSYRAAKSASQMREAISTSGVADCEPGAVEPSTTERTPAAASMPTMCWVPVQSRR